MHTKFLWNENRSLGSPIKTETFGGDKQVAKNTQLVGQPIAVDLVAILCRDYTRRNLDSQALMSWFHCIWLASSSF